MSKKFRKQCYFSWHLKKRADPDPNQNVTIQNTEKIKKHNKFDTSLSEGWATALLLAVLWFHLMRIQKYQNEIDPDL